MTTDTDIITALARKLEAERASLRAQNEALRAGQGTWPEHDDSPAGEQVPRVISADELEEGQTVVRTFKGSMTGWKVFKVANPMGTRWRETDATIVLLEDAPTSDAPTAPRLTVHALNTAPVGSKLERPRFMPWRKRDDGKWVPDWQLGRNARTSEDLIADGWANATLTYPEGGDHE